MADLTYAQLKRVWLDASQGTKYHTNAWASLMAAIAEAESSGDPNATNPTDNGGSQTSWGLWQISDGTHNSVSPNWANPVVNADLAIAKLEDPKGNGLRDWGTYTSGAYKAYLSDSTTAASTIPATGGQAVQATAELTAAEAASNAQSGSQCALGYDQHVGIFFGHGPTVTFCVISKTQVRAVMGGVYIVAGGLTALVGVALAAVAVVPGFGAGRLVKALERTPGAGGKISQAVEKTPKPSYSGAHARSRATTKAATENRRAASGREPAYVGKRRANEPEPAEA